MLGELVDVCCNCSGYQFVSLSLFLSLSLSLSLSLVVFCFYYLFLVLFRLLFLLNLFLLFLLISSPPPLPPIFWSQGKPAGAKAKSAVTEQLGASNAKAKPFDTMNNIVANMLLNMTSSSRFEGSLNVDVNEITTNLVPFPRMHYLVSSLSPLYALADVRVPPRRSAKND